MRPRGGRDRIPGIAGETFVHLDEVDVPTGQQGDRSAADLRAADDREPGVRTVTGTSKGWSSEEDPRAEVRAGELPRAHREHLVQLAAHVAHAGDPPAEQAAQGARIIADVDVHVPEAGEHVTVGAVEHHPGPALRGPARIDALDPAGAHGDRAVGEEQPPLDVDDIHVRHHDVGRHGRCARRAGGEAQQRRARRLRTLQEGRDREAHGCAPSERGGCGAARPPRRPPAPPLPSIF